MKQIIFCADDYGQNTVISQAIINLIRLNRLSATSCMTNSYYWPTHAKWLVPFKNSIDVGLHFNLTEGKPLSKELGSGFTTLPNLIMKAYLKRLDQKKIEGELHAQIDRFIEELGQAPHFIDGHQHIHQLPIIRDALFNVYAQRLSETGCYIRSVYQPGAIWRFKQSGYLKFLFIQWCGSTTFRKELEKRAIPHNKTFSGSYHFADAKKYEKLFPQFLQQVANQGLIMCHPALDHSSEEDAIANSRNFEYQFIQGDLFIEECAKEDVVLARGRFD